MFNKILSPGICFGLTLFLGWLAASDLQAQGSLAKIRKSVREDSKPPEKKEAEEKEGSNASSKPSILNSIVSSVRSQPKKRSKPHRPSRPTRRGGRRRRQRPILISQPTCAPIQVVEHIHIVHTEPLPGMYPGAVYPEAPLANDSPVTAATPTMPVIGQDSLIRDSGEAVLLDPIGPVESDLEIIETFDDWAMRLSAFYGSNFDQLSQGGIGLLIHPANALGLDTSVTMFRERGLGFRDQLWIGDVNAVFGSSIGDLRGRVGIGVNWLADSFGADAGFNLTAGFDYLISHRWTATAEIDLGSLGDTDLFHGQLSAGYRLEKSEFVVGYDYYNLGGIGIDGWFSGLRFRF